MCEFSLRVTIGSVQTVTQGLVHPTVPISSSSTGIGFIPSMHKLPVNELTFVECNWTHWFDFRGVQLLSVLELLV